MKPRLVLAVTGSRAEYGAMRPVFRAISQSSDLELQLIVTGMHLLPDFAKGLEEIRHDNYCQIHTLGMLLAEEGGRAMAQGMGLGIYGMASTIATIAPDILLVQGDRGEMLAAAIAAAHMNIPIVHMSGGDSTGTIDEPIRNAITQFSQIHLTTCATSTARLLQMGEQASRIFQVGEPTLDVIAAAEFAGEEELGRELSLDIAAPILLATMHPVTTEFDDAPHQMRALLEALDELSIQTVFTYPNADAGGRAMVAVLESFRDRPWLRIVPHLGSRNYLGLMRMVVAVVGNSSSGILEAPSFKTPAVNIGTRQHGRTRACNVVDSGYETDDIKKTLLFVMQDQEFRRSLDGCVNPYGDGFTAQKTAKILSTLQISPSLVAKWLASDNQFVPEQWDAV
jgi:GDP/UDP-N,N'-diacetylbacillosamine 2-epimerase (hydrolysing)